MDIEAIEAELKRLGDTSEDSDEVFVGDVTYGEYYFLLMTERDFKVNCMGKPTRLTGEVEVFLTEV